MSELIDRERFSADMRDFQNRVGIWRDEAEDTETRTRADAALATIIETKLILDKQPTIAAPRWHRVSDGLPKDGQCCLFFTVESGIPERDAWFGIYRNAWEGDINMRFDYWMPIEPPKEDA